MSDTAKCVVNDAAHAVIESLDGLLLTRPDLTSLDGYPSTKIISRRSIDRAKVALVSGGGAGHEPAHAGFVGEGMLTAVVSGDIFASPNIHAIYAAIVHTAGTAGTLLIVKNYTGDRLAFSSAAERARLQGTRVEIVFVSDDAALESGRVIGRRGLAGTLFVHKICGALAESGASLDVVAAAARSVAASVATMGASLTVCDIPGRAPSSRLDGSAVEFGLGIHGEPGATRAERVPSADVIVDTLLKKCTERLAAQNVGGVGVRDVALLVNNLGGLSNLEFGIVTRSAVAWIDENGGDAGVRLTRIVAGACMTALNMRGVSLSLLPLSEDITAALDAQTPVRAWPGAAGPPPGATEIMTITQVDRASMPPGVDRAMPSFPEALASTSASVPSMMSLHACFGAICDALEASVDLLNSLDARTGDGDTGNTFRLIAGALRDAVLSPLSKKLARGGSASSDGDLPLSLLSNALADASDALAVRVEGSSGLIYTLMLRAAARALSSPGATVVAAADAAIAAVSAAANAHAGDRSMLDALIPAVAALKDGGGVGAAASAAEAGAAATADMKPAAGRASWVPEETAKGWKDPGAEAVAIWVRAAARVLKGDAL